MVCFTPCESGGVVLIHHRNTSDYRGAQGAHIEPLLLRRRGKENAAAHVETKEENLKGITVMRSLTEAAEWVIDHNRS